MAIKREIQPFGYAEAIHRKTQSRAHQRELIRSGQVDPKEAQAKASIFHGVRIGKISYARSAAV